MLDEKIINLRKPVTVGKDTNAITYTEIRLREPDAGELEKAQAYGTPTGQNITLVSLVAKIPRTVAEKLCQRDLMEASDFFASFYSDGEAMAADGQS